MLIKGHQAFHSFTKSTTNTYTISNGTTSETAKIRDSGQSTEKVFDAFINQDAYNSILNKNALAFKNNGISNMELKDWQVAEHTYEPDFTNNYAREYVEFLADCNRAVRETYTFSRSDYKTHCAIFVFCLTPDGKGLKT